ncbi:hypothetical protein CMI37_04755 [Candidatus Pacearchaeota archaeon]|nr:hypothetical protein [Candidatus Pacearchaeota archaeon]
MNIALPILLLVFGGLTFWVLTESSLKWYFKITCISVFCIFTVIFWLSIHSFLGWPALEDDMPEKIAIHWIVIKEPNKISKSKGKIYVLAESVKEEESSSLARFFGYRRAKIEPRLYGLKYSRDLHEQIEKQLMPKLKSGRPVAGRFLKGKRPKGVGKEADGVRSGKGDGSESQEQEWHFHELLPSEIHRKQQ